MNQKERNEAFRRGQNSNTGEHHTEEEWRERRQLRRQRQRRKRRMRRILTAVCGVAAVAVGVIIVKCFIIDMLISSDHIVVRDPDSVLRTESRDVGSQSVPQTTPPMQSQWETAQATQPITTAASPTTNASVTPAVPVTTGAPSLPSDSGSSSQGALSAEEKLEIASTVTIPSWIQQNFLEVNDYSRVGWKLTDINDIVIHWVANPGTSAEDNREYFASLPYPSANPNGTKASSQFIVGLEGEILQCMPLNEMAYAVKDKRNPDTISIEVCHPDWDGQFNDVTYASVVKLTSWLLQQFHLDTTHILRHYDITGKDCPKYYVNNQDAWEQFKLDVGQYMAENPNIQ